MLERCDKEVLPTYLEATSPGNRALYHRHGFELLEELHWPDDGPPFWPMWRKPLGCGWECVEAAPGARPT